MRLSQCVAYPCSLRPSYIHRFLCPVCLFCIFSIRELLCLLPLWRPSLILFLQISQISPLAFLGGKISPIFETAAVGTNDECKHDHEVAQVSRGQWLLLFDILMSCFQPLHPCSMPQQSWNFILYGSESCFPKWRPYSTHPGGQRVKCNSITRCTTTLHQWPFAFWTTTCPPSNQLWLKMSTPSRIGPITDHWCPGSNAQSSGGYWSNWTKKLQECKYSGVSLGRIFIHRKWPNSNVGLPCVGELHHLNNPTLACTSWLNLCKKVVWNISCFAASRLSRLSQKYNSH